LVIGIVVLFLLVLFVCEGGEARINTYDISINPAKVAH
jgi:hypothetical protein